MTFINKNLFFSTLIVGGLLFAVAFTQATPLFAQGSNPTPTPTPPAQNAPPNPSLLPPPTSAASEGARDTTCGVNCYIQWIIANVFSFFLEILGYLIATLVGILIPIGRYNAFVDAPAVKVGWDVVRDISNMFFVLILLVISFGTILHLEQYPIKKMLPKVLLMAILVNFSKTIAGLIIDFSQVVTLTFVAAYQQTGAGNFIQALGLTNLTNIAGKADGAIPQNAITTAGIAGAYFVALIYAVISLVVILAYIVIFVIRIVALWMLIIFSPLAYVLSVVPMGQKYAGMWWDYFSKYVIIGPVLAFFLWLSLATLPRVGETTRTAFGGENAETTVLGQIPAAVITESGQPLNLFNFVISIAMLMISLVFAQQMGGAVGKTAGFAYGKIATGGKAVGRAVLPTRAGYAIASGALGVVGRIPLVSRLGGIGNAALIQREKLRQKRQAGEKNYAPTLATMRESDLRVMQKRMQPGSILGKGGTIEQRLGTTAAKVANTVISAPGRVFQTNAGKNLEKQIVEKSLDRLQFTPPVDRRTKGYIRDRQEAIEKQRELKNFSKSRPLTDDEILSLKEAEAREKSANQVLTGYQADVKRQLVEQARKIAGHKVDFDNNDLAVDGDLLTKTNAFMKRNPEAIPTTPRKVTEPGILYGKAHANDEQRFFLERMKASDFSSWGPAQWNNQGLINKAMEASPLAAVLNQFQQMDRGSSDDEIRKAISSQFSWAHTQQRTNPKLGNTMRDAFARALNDPGAEEIIRKAAEIFGRSPGAMRQLLKNGFASRGSVVLGEDGTGGGTAGATGAAAQTDIDVNRYAWTRALEKKYGEKYTESDEYKKDKDQYYQPENFAVVKKIMEARDQRHERTLDDLEEFKAQGPEDAITQALLAKLNKQSEFGEASIFVDGGDIGLDAAARSYNKEKDAAERDRIIPEVIDQYRKRGYSEDALQSLEEALRMATNISLVDENRSVGEQQQALAHERSHAWDSADTKAANEEGRMPLSKAVWGALTEQERTDISARMRNMKGKDMSIDEIISEYFAEASANETRWGRENGIRFTGAAREVWSNAGAPTATALTGPDTPLNPVQLAKAISDAVREGNQELGAEITAGLTSALKDLTTQIGSLNMNRIGDLAAAVQNLVNTHQVTNSQLRKKLLELAYSQQRTRKSIDTIATKLTQPRATTAREAMESAET